MSDIGITLRGNHSGLNASLQKAGSDVKKFGDDATKSLRGVQDETRNLHKTLSALGGQMGTALTAAFAVNKVSDFTHAIIDAQTNLDKLHNTLSFSLGAGQVTGQMEYLRKTTNALGLEFGSTAVMYAKFAAAARGTSMEGANTKKVFESIGKASTVMGLSAADTQGVMLALTQILSKGTTQAEEIRGQLGERLPGAFAIASRAMGVTTQEFSKMLELGQVVSADFLPKFAAQMEKEVAGSFDKASHSMQASLNRMSNAWLEFKQTVAQSGTATAIAAEVNGLTNYMTVLSEAMQRAGANGSGAMGQIATATGTIIARAPFDVLAFSANTLNGTLNLLSMGALKLNTNVDTLPGVFDTAAQRAAALDSNLLAAEKDLTQLRAKLDQVPDNIYLKSETHQAWLLVQELRAAKAAKDGLSGNTGPGNVSGIAAQYPTRSQSYAADAERVNKIRAGYEAVQQSLSGVSANYLKNLAALKAGFDEGMTTQEQYTKDVIALIDKETGFKKTAAKAQSDAAKAQEEARKAAAKAEADWQNEVFKAAESESDARERSIKTLKDQIDKETAHTAALGLSKEAIADLEVATLYETAAAKEQLATRADQIDWSGQMGEKYREEARLLRELAAAKKAGGIRATEIESQKEAKKYADDMLKEQKRAAEESAKYWEDALMRAFESGKGFFQSLWDTIKNTLKTQILKVTVQGVMGTLGIGATGAAFAGGAGGSDILGLANTASSLANLYSAGSSIITIGSQVAAGTMGIANALGTLAANATGTGISGLLAANGAFGTAAAGTASAAAGGLSAGLAAIPGWGWAALGVAAVASIFGGGGETRSGATYDNVGGVARYQQGPSGGEIAGAEARRLFNVATTSIEGALAAVGSKAKLTGFTAGLESSGKGRGFDFAGGFIDGVGFGEYSGREGDKNGQFPLKSQSAEQAFANYATQLKQATVQALQAATDVPNTIKDMLSGINANTLTGEAVDALLSNINVVVGMVNSFNQAVLSLPFANLKNLSFDAAAGLLAVTGGLDVLGANLAGYYDTYYSESERLAMTSANVTQALAKVNVAMPATKDAYRALVNGLDLTTTAGRNTYAVMLALAPQFAQVADAAESAATESVKLMNDVFDTLQDRLTNLIDSIASERAAVASASAGMLGLQPKTAAQLAAEIAASKVALPSDAGVLSALAAKTAAQAGVDAATTTLQNAQGSQSATSSAYGGAITAAQTGLANTIGYYKNLAASFQDLAVSFNGYQIRVNATTAPLNDAYSYNASTNQLNGWGSTTDATQTGRSYTHFLQDVQRFTNAVTANGWLSTLQGGNTALANAANAVTAAQAAYNTAMTAAAAVTTSASTDVATANAKLTAADAVVKQALLAYADAMTQYSGDAEKAVKVLSQLREETVAYYEAQKELAGLMSTSAANLRAAVRNSQFGQLASGAALAQQQRDFATNYSLALSTGGATKAGYADNLTAALPALTSALMDTSSTRSAWALATAKLYTQSETIAAQLDSAAAGMNYEAESLSLLGSIDVALGELDTNTAILKNAIDGGTATSAAGLRAIVTQLGGVPAFASGGSFAGGLRMVGEHGAELEVTGPSRIFNASQTRSLLQSGGAGGSNMARLEALVERQGKQLEAMSFELRSIATSSNKTYKSLDAVIHGEDSINTAAIA